MEQNTLNEKMESCFETIRELVAIRGDPAQEDIDLLQRMCSGWIHISKKQRQNEEREFRREVREKALRTILLQRFADVGQRLDKKEYKKVDALLSEFCWELPWLPVEETTLTLMLNLLGFLAEGEKSQRHTTREILKRLTKALQYKVSPTEEQLSRAEEKLREGQLTPVREQS